MKLLYDLQHRALRNAVFNLSMENIHGILWQKNAKLARYVMQYAMQISLSPEQQQALHWNFHFRKVGEVTALVYEFQPLQSETFDVTECPFIVVLSQRETKYFTVEQTMDGMFVLCAWEKDRHLNFGIFTKDPNELFEKIAEIANVTDKQSVFHEQLRLIGEEMDEWKNKQKRISADDIMVKLLYAKLMLDKENYSGFEQAFNELQRMKQMLVIWSTPKLRLDYVTYLARDAIEYVEKNKHLLEPSVQETANEEIAALRTHLDTLPAPQLKQTDDNYLTLANGVEEASVKLLEVVKQLSVKQ